MQTVISLRFLIGVSVLFLGVIAQQPKRSGRGAQRKDVSAEAAEEQVKDECIDPNLHKQVLEDIDALKIEKQSYETELKQCVDTAVSSEAMDSLVESIDKLKADFEKKELEAVTMKEQLNSKNSLIDQLQNQVESIPTSDSKAQYQDKIARLEGEIAEKNTMLNALRSEAESSSKHTTPNESYLFSWSQFTDRVSRVHGFAEEVFRLFQGWAKALGLHTFSAKVMEARIEVTAAIQPRLAVLQPYWSTVKQHTSTVCTVIKTQYSERVKPIVQKLSVIVADGIKVVNNGLSEILKPIFQTRPLLKAYFPDGALDRVFFFAYILLVKYITWKLLLFFFVRPVLCMLSCVTGKTCCKRSSKKPEKKFMVAESGTRNPAKGGDKKRH